MTFFSPSVIADWPPAVWVSHFYATTVFVPRAPERGARGVQCTHSGIMPSAWPAVFAPMVPGDRPDRLPARDQNYPRPCAWPLQRPELPQTPRKLYRLLWIQSLAAAQLAYSDVLHYNFKGTMSQDFWPSFFFSWFQPIWDSLCMCERIFKKVLISRMYLHVQKSPRYHWQWHRAAILWHPRVKYFCEIFHRLFL